MHPQNSIIFFVDADSIFNGESSAATVAQFGIKIRNVAHTIATEFQAVSAHAHPVLSDIESILSYLTWPRVAIGNYHFSERRPIEDGTVSALIGISDIMYGQALTSVESDHQTPVLPLKAPPVQSEAWPVRLSDFERLDVRSMILNSVARVIAWLRRQRPFSILLHANDLHRVEVNNGPDAFDGPSVSVICAVAAQET